MSALVSEEMLKRSFANVAFEAVAAAGYTSRMALAEAVSLSRAAPLLQASLGEEQAMSAWIDGRNAALTIQYVERSAAGEAAGY